MYSRLLRTILCTALKSVVSIQHIRHVECSLPSLPTERPKLSLINISNISSTTCISDSRWRIDWKPASWWVSVAATGSKWGLAFNALTTVSHISISGVVKTRFSEDLTAIRLAFVDEPQLDMTVKSEVAMAVGMGVYNMGIPVPVEEQIEDVIRNELRRFIMDTILRYNLLSIYLLRLIYIHIYRYNLIKYPLEVIILYYIMARRTYDEMQMTATIASVHSDACRDPVEDIRNAAFNEYQRVKKHKQCELHARRNINTISNEVVLTKQQKKKDDNHASAVASRSKQEFLLKKFEDALLKKIQQTNLLSLGYTTAEAKIEHMKKLLAQRDAAIHLLNHELAMYRKGNNSNINGNNNRNNARLYLYKYIIGIIERAHYRIYCIVMYIDRIVM